MNQRQAQAMTAHLVFFAATALFLAAQSSGPQHRLARAAWAGWSGAGSTATLVCRASFTGAGGYLERLGRTLWQAEGESLVGYDAPVCER
jgi:hypothetical protein